MAIADITLLSGFEANTEHLDKVSKPPSNQIITIATLCDGMSIMAPIALHPWKEGSPISVSSPALFLALALWGARVRGGGVIFINTWPVKPFETVPVIKGYTNEI